MSKLLDKTKIKGGYVMRDAKTGRFVSVSTSTGVKKSSAKTLAVIKSASEKRKAALKRLADR